MKQLGVEFKVHPSDVDERKIIASSPREFALKAAFLKAADVARYYADGIIIAADTIVVVDDQILGKPLDEKEARQMLQALSGKKHQVITGLAVWNARTGATLLDSETTEVHFRPLTDTDIEEYIQTGDPLDKAGAYGIQHREFHPVEHLKGCYASVMGLPLCHLARVMRSCGVEPAGDLPARCQA
ncbi:MAG: Maf family protein, partial [Candidatus Sumerlaeia bacterium]|nr:Maf family protein [Candidatus Sumerlaeia bacterium]